MTRRLSSVPPETRFDEPARRRALALVLVAGLAMAAVACASSNADNGVASLNGSSADGGGGTTTSLSKEQREQELLKYTQCLREHGANVPDPQVDANGNLQLGGGGLRGGGGGGGNGQTQGTVDRNAIQEARKACGDPPRNALGGFNRENQAQFQDAALKFAKCMREHGVDVPDPDFSQAPQGGGDGGAGGSGGPPGTGAGGGGRRGFFGNLDQNDPKIQAAFQECRSTLGNLGGGGPGGPGGPGGGTGGGSAPSNSNG